MKYLTIGKEHDKFVTKGEFDTQKEAIDLANKINTEQDVWYYDWCIKNTKFYEFNQNNSGGIYDVTEDVTSVVIIEAYTEQQAVEILEPMIEDQSASCRCCGERWNTSYVEEVNLNYEWEVKTYYTSEKTEQETEEEWYRLYGNLPYKVKPTKQQKNSYFVFTTNIIMETIEQYAQFMCNNFGNSVDKGKPELILHYFGGTKKLFYTQY